MMNEDSDKKYKNNYEEEKKFYEEEKKFYEMVTTIKPKQTQVSTITLKNGSYYLIAIGTISKIEMVKVSTITKKCALFEFPQSGKDPTWFVINNGYSIIEELSKDFVRDFKINQIDNNPPTDPNI